MSFDKYFKCYDNVKFHGLVYLAKFGIRNTWRDRDKREMIFEAKGVRTSSSCHGVSLFLKALFKEFVVLALAIFVVVLLKRAIKCFPRLTKYRSLFSSLFSISFSYSSSFSSFVLREWNIFSFSNSISSHYSITCILYIKCIIAEKMLAPIFRC